MNKPTIRRAHIHESSFSINSPNIGNQLSMDFENGFIKTIIVFIKGCPFAI